MPGSNVLICGVYQRYLGNRMSEVSQVASAMLVILFAAVMLVAGQLYTESRENKSVRIPTVPAVQITAVPL